MLLYSGFNIHTYVSCNRAFLLLTPTIRVNIRRNICTTDEQRRILWILRMSLKISIQEQGKIKHDKTSKYCHKVHEFLNENIIRYIIY